MLEQLSTSLAKIQATTRDNSTAQPLETATNTVSVDGETVNPANVSPAA
jgi:hypothetical protein